MMLLITAKLSNYFKVFTSPRNRRVHLSIAVVFACSFELVAAQTVAPLEAETTTRPKTEVNTELKMSDQVHSAFEIPRSTVIDVKDPISGRTYPLFIKLPKSYRSQPNKRYPVIYLTDSWYSFQIVSGATRFPMNFNQMDEAIIVAISYSKESRGSSSRNRDYTPTVNPAWKDITGGAAAHRDFIETTVFAYVEGHYRAEADSRIFIGNSFGGLFGSYILMTKPEMFDSYILGSPSYWWDGGYIFELEKQFKQSIKPVSAKVFIGIGELEKKVNGAGEDMVKEAQAFYDLMQQWPLSPQTKLLIIPEADHQMAFPTTAIHGLQWILGKCPPKGNCLQGNHK